MFTTSIHSCLTTKKLEALNYPVGTTRLDLALKITGVAEAKAPNTVPWKSQITPTPTRCTASFTSFAHGMDSGSTAGYPDTICLPD